MIHILVDISNLLFGTYQAVTRSDRNVGLPPASKIELCKEYTLSKIASYITKTQVPNENVTIAWDCGSWRKKDFPYYKAKRAEGRKDDYQDMIEFFNEFREEIVNNFPWKNVFIRGCEGDDIIGTLTRYHQKNGDGVLIFSKDKDFLQLINHNTKLVDPFNSSVKDEFVINKKKELVWKIDTVDEARRFTLFHIILGDKDDGIPSVIYDDDYLVNPAKLSKRFGVMSVMKTFFSDDEDMNIENIRKYHHNFKENFQRNAKLIDLNFIPKEVKQEIMDDWITLKVQDDFKVTEEWCNEKNFFDLLRTMNSNRFNT